MGDRSKIEWTEATWNPVTGCSKVSPGCEHCYAERLALRFGWSKKPWTGPNASKNVVLHPERLELPLRWRNKPRRIFVNSMSDLFHESVPDEFIDRVFAVMAMAEQHTFQVLTKRPERMREYLTTRTSGGRHIWRAGQAIEMPRGQHKPDTTWPLPNVWLGVSVEDQRRADERIPLLLQTPAAVRFLSCEPLLGPVNLDLPRCEVHDRAEVVRTDEREEFCNECALDGFSGELSHGHWLDPLNGGIEWVIVGSESGPSRRPCDLEWVRSIRDQCVAAGVPFFLKQLHVGGRKVARPELDGRTWDEMPQGGA